MIKSNKSINKLLIPVLITISIFCFSLNTFAAYTRTVSVSWDHISQLDQLGCLLEYDTNRVSENITYLHGYTYTETTKDTTSYKDTFLLGLWSRIHHERTYYTY